jgi:putative kinase
MWNHINQHAKKLNCSWASRSYQEKEIFPLVESEFGFKNREEDLVTFDFTVAKQPQSFKLSFPEVVERYLPQVIECLLSQLESKEKKRYIVGIFGPAGAGKSTISSLLALVGNKWHQIMMKASSDGSYLSSLQLSSSLSSEICATLSMDAFHFPNEYLVSHSLKSHKGRIDTINVDAFLRDLKLLQEVDAVALPDYDRESSHDPVPNSIQITACHKIIFVEGLYVGIGHPKLNQLLDSSYQGDVQLSNELVSNWVDVTKMMDECIYLSLPIEISKQRTVDRKVKNGLSRDQAETHFEAVDAPVYRLLASHMS